MDPRQVYEQAVARHRAGDLTGAEGLYRQVLAAAPGSFVAHQMLGVLCAQQGRNGEARDLIGAALALKPDAPDALFNLGRVLKNDGDLDGAIAHFGRALALRPGYDAARIARAETHNLKGIALQQAGQLDEALAACEAALADAPDYSDAVNNRAATLWALGRNAEALEGFDQALRLKPDYVETHYNRGNVLRDLLRLDEAVAAFDRAIALNPDFAPARRNKAFVALLRGDFATGLPLYEWRKRLTPPVEARDYPQPLWTGQEDIKGKTVFAYVEQGMGDAIQFYRFVAPLIARGARVVLGVHPRLIRLLQAGRWPVTLVDIGAAPPAFDCHIPLMSLPLALRLTADTISGDTPYLIAEPERVAHWRMRIGTPGFKVGIAWQGAVGGITGRAMTLADFAPLARLPGVRLISLQKGLGTEQLPVLPMVETLGAEFDEGPDAFLDSAAVMENLDLVITLDSAPAHLAGALGRPVWLALKQVPDWRWFLDRRDSPWYPQMRLFRQSRDGDWTDVFAWMAEELAEKMR